MTTSVFTVIGLTETDFDCLSDDFDIYSALGLRTLTAWTAKDALDQMVEEVKRELLEDEDINEVRPVASVEETSRTGDRVNFRVTMVNGDVHGTWLEYEVREFMLPSR